ncbi:MAG TPA: hypothetical protein VK203_28835 [Nostocaceae cyanobacterium]|nr:hypothetical protein [Nostocaceae cyanobacterium]
MRLTPFSTLRFWQIGNSNSSLPALIDISTENVGQLRSDVRDGFHPDLKTPTTVPVVDEVLLNISTNRSHKITVLCHRFTTTG